MPTGPKPPLPENAIRLAVSGVNDEAEWANIFHLSSDVSEAPTIPQMNTLCNDFGTLYLDNLHGLASTASHLLLVKGVWFGPGETEVVGIAAFDNEGSDTNESQPGQVAICISWPISAYYRGGHPRSYMAGVCADRLASMKSITSAAATAYADAGAAFRVAVNEMADTPFTAVTLGCYSFASHNEWRSVPIFRPFIGATVHTRLDTQRRRLGKEGS